MSRGWSDPRERYPTATEISTDLRLGFSLAPRGTSGERIPRNGTSRFEPMNHPSEGRAELPLRPDIGAAQQHRPTGFMGRVGERGRSTASKPPLPGPLLHGHGGEGEDPCVARPSCPNSMAVERYPRWPAAGDRTPAGVPERERRSGAAGSAHAPETAVIARRDSSPPPPGSVPRSGRVPGDHFVPPPAHFRPPLREAGQSGRRKAKNGNTGQDWGDETSPLRVWGGSTVRQPRIGTMNLVGQPFQAAGSAGFLARRTNGGLESPQNRPAGKPALPG